MIRGYRVRYWFDSDTDPRGLSRVRGNQDVLDIDDVGDDETDRYASQKNAPYGSWHNRTPGRGRDERLRRQDD